MPKSMLKNVLLKSVQKYTMDVMDPRSYASDVFAFATQFCEISSHDYDRKWVKS